MWVGVKYVNGVGYCGCFHFHPHTLPTHFTQTHQWHPHTLPTHFTHTHQLHPHTLPSHFTHLHFTHILYPLTLPPYTQCTHWKKTENRFFQWSQPHFLFFMPDLHPCIIEGYLQPRGFFKSMKTLSYFSMKNLFYFSIILRAILQTKVL